MLAQALMPLCIVLVVGHGLPTSKSLEHTEKTITKGVCSGPRYFFTY